MPSSVSNAPADVTTQAGHGWGPRSDGVIAGHVDQRWPSPGSTSAKESSVENGDASNDAKGSVKGGCSGWEATHGSGAGGLEGKDVGEERDKDSGHLRLLPLGSSRGDPGALRHYREVVPMSRHSFDFMEDNTADEWSDAADGLSGAASAHLPAWNHDNDRARTRHRFRPY